MPAAAQTRVPPSVGRYDLLEKIADGGVGSVYRGRDRTTGQIVAVEIVSATVLASNDLVVRRFEQDTHLDNLQGRDQVLWRTESGPTVVSPCRELAILA